MTLDNLVKAEKPDGVEVTLPPAPKGKSIWGSITISDRGQIVIPKAAREKFGLTGGQRLIVLGDEVGIALIPAEAFEEKMRQFMKAATQTDAK